MSTIEKVTMPNGRTTTEMQEEAYIEGASSVLLSTGETITVDDNACWKIYGRYGANERKITREEASIRLAGLTL